MSIYFSKKRNNWKRRLKILSFVRFSGWNRDMLHSITNFEGLFLFIVCLLLHSLLLSLFLTVIFWPCNVTFLKVSSYTPCARRNSLVCLKKKVYCADYRWALCVFACHQANNWLFPNHSLHQKSFEQSMRNILSSSLSF